MNLAGLIFLLVAHYFTGNGIVRLFRIQLEPVATLCFSMLYGVFVASIVPCIMEFSHVELTASNIYIWLGATSILFCIPSFINVKQPKVPRITLPKLYEVPFILVFLWLAITSVWRCYYYPVTPRDMLTGPELIAEFAVREKTMINSVFSVDLRMHPDTPNNIFKSPFITGLQIIYKLLVHPFGQQWLSVVFLSFTLWLYTFLRSRIHPFLACILLLVFFSIPELFAYTYIILHDYSNMVFFFAGVYFLSKYLESRRKNMLIWSASLLGVATYIRSETLVLIALGIPALAFYFFRKKDSLKNVLVCIGLYVAVPFFFNLLCGSIFIKQLVPLEYSLSSLINDPFNFGLLFEKLGDIGTGLILTSRAMEIYAMFFRIFLGVLIVDVIWPRKFNREACVALVCVAVVYLGMGVIAYLINGVTLENTVKRGLFKIIPFMVWYMSNSGVLQKLSDILKRYEDGNGMPRAAPAQKKNSKIAAKRQKAVAR